MVAIKEAPASSGARFQEALESKARCVLASAFPGSRAEIGWSPGGEILGGFLGWDGFIGLPEGEPRALLDATLSERLTQVERERIFMLIPMPMDALLDHLEPLD